MRKYILFIMLTGGCMTATAQELTISGQLKNLPNDTLQAEMGYRGSDVTERQTIVTKDGKFSFTLTPKEVSTVVLQAVKDGKRVREPYIRLTAVPGEQAIINGTLKEPSFSGSLFYRQYQTAQAAQASFMKEYDAAVDLLNQTIAADSTRKEEAREQYKATTADIRKRWSDAIVAYVREHPDDEASATLLSHVEKEQVHAVVDMLSARVRNGRMRPSYEPYVEYADKAIAREQAEAFIQPGKPAPDFTLQDINGKPFGLNSLRGRYVLLDFWGSWCYWCIKAIPQMKAYYQKYKGKYEVVGIDCNDTEQKWKDAVEKHQIPWLHVRNEKENDVSVRYAVSGYPTFVLINPEGIIDRVYLGEEPELYQRLDELFGNE